MPLPQQKSFVSLLSQLRFGILNTNESTHKSPTFMSSPPRMLYANECHYQQHHQYQTPGDYGLYSQTHIGQDMSFDSGNSSSEEGRSVNASVTINPGENQLHSGNSDSYRLTSASGGTKNPSSPRFKDIHTSDSSITSTPIKHMRTKGKHR
ncbi:hypothetical protein O181_008449 [Austropuccinia psidii MF-1]|uniref:Uncharacterized protein n=1 Tax=Austropuccinia psidii MF-1 TaxID=1389203 RepID=A0A9Q3BML3_9BASI|nr:hypothetical protein [Austropuccinia psidii MF-1]